jgi:hypothetical protein
LPQQAQFYYTFVAMRNAHYFFLTALLVTGIWVCPLEAQNNPVNTQLKLHQALEKKAEYHRLTSGVQDGYRIKIHFGIDRDAAESIRSKFSTQFPDYNTYKEYQQPNFVVLVGDFRTKLEAFESLKKVQVEFPNAFIVKGKIKTK